MPSIYSLLATGLACLVPFATAYTQPVGDKPSGNPISSPGLHAIVPVGQGYTITWEPTTTGTITLVLLKGPSTNAVPQYSIIENYPNTGNFIWVPKDNLEDSDGDTGYGIQLIVDATGQYQYSTQFGISNDESSPSGYGNGNSTSSSSASAYTTSSSITSSGWAHGTGYPHHPANGTYHPHPTGYMPHNGTHHNSTGGHAKPTHYTTSHTKPASTSTRTKTVPSSTAPVRPSETSNAASSLTGSFAGLVFAAGIAVYAL